MDKINWSLIQAIMLGEKVQLEKEVEMMARGAEGSLFSREPGECGECKFKHPLSSAPQNKSVSERNAKDLANDLKSTFDGKGLSPQELCFMMWRCGADYLPEDALTPADPVLPDFTVWNHLAAKAALAACIRDNQIKPAFLMFQLAPVQEFIAQARSTRDLWSGSYMLSWLMAHALKAVTDIVGPAAIIFPNLRGNGIYDALHQSRYGKEIWDKLTACHGDAIGIAEWKLTPTLPNRFLALVPADCAEELARKAEQAIRDELASIADSVWQWVEQKAKEAMEDKEYEREITPEKIQQWKKRWDAQILDFPKLTWAVQPWGSREEILAAYRELPLNKLASDRTRPADNLDKLLALLANDANNPGLLWSAHYALVDAKLAARRNTRDFDAWHSVNADNAVKDSLSGKEEIIGNRAFWDYLVEKENKLFKAKGHSYGAMNLVKRLWCRPEALKNGAKKTLWDKLVLHPADFAKAIGFDSTQDVAKNNENGGKYIAVIAMDGDEMGKWISGEKTPMFKDQLASVNSNFADIHRPLTLAYHLQFSEALANFSIWRAKKIVESKTFKGQLIYAGGDDVLAMLPADKAIDCARELQGAFRKNYLEEKTPEEKSPVGYPLLMPGSQSNVSAGIAIGSDEAPLQMLVKEAQAAEHRAKHDYDRAAVAISLYKRSGEIIQWGCKWNRKKQEPNEKPEPSEALALMKLLEKLKNNGISARFPYALARVLEPYRLKEKQSISVETMKDIILRELAVVIDRQGADLNKAEKEELMEKCKNWCDSCTKLEDFIQPFLTEAFINRDRGDKNDEN